MSGHRYNNGAGPKIVAELPAWFAAAACHDAPPDVFFPTSGRGRHLDWSPARAICNRCPIQLECLEFALDNNERHGMWGSKNEREREQIIRRRKRGPK